MTDEVRNDFIEMIRRAADFSGIQLVAWCIMSNHFHILAYLPEPKSISEDEVFRRYGVLKGKVRLEQLQEKIGALRQSGENGIKEADQILERIQGQMYKVGEFMKVIKQWLTQEYNKRYSHTGTLWEAVYKDVLVPAKSHALGERAAYIHLNPIRASIDNGFDNYLWSSFTALKRGDEMALSGMRLIYGEEANRDEILEAHSRLMSRLLEQYKFERAIDIVRKRNAGFDVPSDPLTDEALMVQAAEHLSKAIDESVEDKIIRKSKGRPAKGAKELDAMIEKLLAEKPQMTGAAIAEATGRPISTIYLYLQRRKAKQKLQ